jgi:hypothetical protein
MPNYITTIIKSTPEVILNLTRRNEKDEIIIDFNNIIPKPNLLNGVTVDGTGYLIEYLFNPDSSYNKVFFDKFIESGGFSKYSEKRIRNFITMLQNKLEHEATSWYDWCIEKWGTKWNAYDFDITEDDISDGIITFNTAWSMPYPVIEKLSENNPDTEIEVKYADEDIGHNQGHFIMKNGEIIQEIEIFDPILFAYELKGYDIPPHYKINPETGKYEYDENED